MITWSDEGLLTLMRVYHFIILAPESPNQVLPERAGIPPAVHSGDDSCSGFTARPYYPVESSVRPLGNPSNNFMAADVFGLVKNRLQYTLFVRYLTRLNRHLIQRRMGIDAHSTKKKNTLL